MLRSFINNLPSWFLMRIMELGILYTLHVAYSLFSEGQLLATMYESIYYTAVYAYVGYIYLGYAVLQIVLLALLSAGWKLRIICFISYISPIYVPISILLSGSLPDSNPIYLLRSPFFLVALLLAVLVNFWGYSRLCSRAVEAKAR